MAEIETKETWTYLGQRLISNGQMRHAWHDESGDIDNQLHLFKKLKGTAPGSQYEMRVTRDDTDRNATTASVGAFVGMHPDQAFRMEMASIDRADRTRYEGERRSKNAANELTEACEPLRLQYRKMIGNARKSAFIAALIQEVTR